MTHTEQHNAAALSASEWQIQQFENDRLFVVFIVQEIAVVFVLPTIALRSGSSIATVIVVGTSLVATPSIFTTSLLN